MPKKETLRKLAALVESSFECFAIFVVHNENLHNSLIHRNYVGFIVQYPAGIVNAWEADRCWSGQQDDICILHG